MNSAFAEVRAAVAKIPQKIDEAKKAANIFVVVDTDNEGAINAALAKALGGAGWAVAKSRTGAAAICAATVTEGVQKSDMSTFYFPKISITLRSNGGGDVFSFSIEAAKQGAINPDIAKLRAYTALAAAIEKQFSVELNK
jgi:F0F1-type ATP synthase membrane subunit c/vacuolar-type H+-ATPase subunit K